MLLLNKKAFHGSKEHNEQIEMCNEPSWEVQRGEIEMRIEWSNVYFYYQKHKQPQ